MSRSIIFISKFEYQYLFIVIYKKNSIIDESYEWIIIKLIILKHKIIHFIYTSFRTSWILFMLMSWFILDYFKKFSIYSLRIYSIKNIKRLWLLLIQRGTRETYHIINYATKLDHCTWHFFNFQALHDITNYKINLHDERKHSFITSNQINNELHLH